MGRTDIGMEVEADCALRLLHRSLACGRLKCHVDLHVRSKTGKYCEQQHIGPKCSCNLCSWGKLMGRPR